MKVGNNKKLARTANENIELEVRNIKFKEKIVRVE